MKNLPFRDRLRFAVNGVRSSFSTEASFRFQVVAALVMIVLLVVLRASATWWAIILITIGGVLASEMMNTALERLVDHLHPEVHPAIKLAKDCAAGAVLILSLISLGVLTAFLWVSFDG